MKKILHCLLALIAVFAMVTNAAAISQFVSPNSGRFICVMTNYCVYFKINNNSLSGYTDLLVHEEATVASMGIKWDNYNMYYRGNKDNNIAASMDFDVTKHPVTNYLFKIVDVNGIPVQNCVISHPVINQWATDTVVINGDKQGLTCQIVHAGS